MEICMLLVLLLLKLFILCVLCVHTSWLSVASAAGVQAEVWNIDVAARSSEYTIEYTDVQLSADDVRPGRRVIAHHTKVFDSS